MNEKRKHMKTLYITDLDGTLLNSKAELTKKTKSMLSEAINSGALFTVATARTFATVLQMFSEVNLKLPLILMNGVMIFDTEENKILTCKSLDNDTLAGIFEIYNKHGVYPLVYRNKDKYLEIEYYSTDNPYQMKYINARTEKSGKEFVFSPEFSYDGKGEVIYIVTLDTYDKILPLYEDISNVTGISSVFYRDNYTDCYFLEIFAKKTSKGTAMEEVKKLIGAEQIIAFGDNLNDMEMFRYADESYAVGNACDELKRVATSVIGTNDDDAVAKFILENYMENLNE